MSSVFIQPYLLNVNYVWYTIYTPETKGKHCKKKEGGKFIKCCEEGNEIWQRASGCNEGRGSFIILESAILAELEEDAESKSSRWNDREKVNTRLQDHLFKKFGGDTKVRNRIAITGAAKSNKDFTKVACVEKENLELKRGKTSRCT